MGQVVAEEEEPRNNRKRIRMKRVWIVREVRCNRVSVAMLRVRRVLAAFYCTGIGNG